MDQPLEKRMPLVLRRNMSVIHPGRQEQLSPDPDRLAQQGNGGRAELGVDNTGFLAYLNHAA